jgi:hypothetical protein
MNDGRRLDQNQVLNREVRGASPGGRGVAEVEKSVL